MRLRSFNAPDIQDAMSMVRETLGEDAIIISTTRDPQNHMVCVTAAIDNEEEYDFSEPVADEPAPTLHPINSFIQAYNKRKYDSDLQELAKVLQFHNTPEYLVQKLLEVGRFLRSQQAKPMTDTRQGMMDIFNAAYSFSPLQLEAPGWRYMLVGPPGVGKTTAIAKMASRLAMQKLQVVVITTDTKRAGGVEQLAAFTNILGLELKVAASRIELAQLLLALPANSRVLIDSAGTNPYNFEEIKEIKQLADFDGIEPVLVGATGGDSNEAEEMVQSFSYLAPQRLLVTRVDTTRRLGSILAMADVGNLALCNISSSPKVVGEFKPIDAMYLANLLMQYRFEMAA